MKLHSAEEHVWPDAENVFASFKSRHGRALSNHVVKHFLDEQSHYQLFMTAICFPTEENWEKLDQSFRQFYIEIRFIHYIAKVLWRYAKDFRVKSQRDEAHYLPILDQPIQNDGESSATSYKDQLADYCKGDILREEEEMLADQIDDSYLQAALRQLTDRQLKILHCYFVSYITQEEIAHHFDVSQQSISKTMNTALAKLKRLYEAKAKDNNGR